VPSYLKCDAANFAWDGSALPGVFTGNALSAGVRNEAEETIVVAVWWWGHERYVDDELYQR
jgi:hypothetical protein